MFLSAGVSFIVAANNRELERAENNSIIRLAPTHADTIATKRLLPDVIVTPADEGAIVLIADNGARRVRGIGLNCVTDGCHQTIIVFVRKCSAAIVTQEQSTI